MTRSILRIVLLGLLTCVFTAPVMCQKLTAQDRELVTTAREIMSKARYCALVTLDARLRPQVRTMDPFAAEDDMTIWLGTNPRTRKVAEIRRNPRVVLHYFDPDAGAYVTLHGTARIVTDRDEKSRRWKDDWKDFYPDREKDYVLIEVTPTRLEVVSEKKKILGDPATWRSPFVDFKRGRF